MPAKRTGHGSRHGGKSMAYLPIEEYGMIGDMHTVALVGTNGSIDWFCVPNFDSPSVFCKILDDEKGGSFRVAPIKQDVACKQFYWPDTNVLVTRYLGKRGGRRTDRLHAGHRCQTGRKPGTGPGAASSAVSRPCAVSSRCAWNASRRSISRAIRTASKPSSTAWVFRSPKRSLGLCSDIELQIEGRQGRRRLHFDRRTNGGLRPE